MELIIEQFARFKLFVEKLGRSTYLLGGSAYSQGNFLSLSR